MACQHNYDDQSHQQESSNQRSSGDDNFWDSVPHNRAPPLQTHRRRVASRPIPIPRRKDETTYHNNTESKLAQSLPAHFLRAPRVAPEEGDPPPYLVLSSEDATTTAASTPYGSLRDSQQFFVGSLPAPSATSSGIVLAPLQRQRQHNHGPGSLSALMQQQQGGGDEEMEDEAPILSSSLTGLEILRRNQPHRDPVVVVPRSFSEPRPPMDALFLPPPVGHEQLRRPVIPLIAHQQHGNSMDLQDDDDSEEDEQFHLDL